MTKPTRWPAIGSIVTCADCGDSVEVVYSWFHRWDAYPTVEVRTRWHRRTEDNFDHSTLFVSGLLAEQHVGKRR